jgi:hypothetical protein
MLCVTVKKGVECSFMTSQGCGYNGNRCRPVIEPCEGCSKTMTVEDGVFCRVAPDPSRKWGVGSCNFATHRQIAVQEDTQKLNPLKASKRAAAAKKKK